MGRLVTAKGKAFTKANEGRALKAYKDIAGVITVGFGNTNYDKWAVQYLGGPITMSTTITEEQADFLLDQTLEHNYSPAVEKALGPAVTDAQFDMGNDFHYNTGAIGKASWVPKLKAGEDYHAALASWNKAAGRVVGGLVSRREREYKLAHNGDYGNVKVATVSVNAAGKESGAGKPIPVASLDHPLAGTPGMLRQGDSMPEVADEKAKLAKLGYAMSAGDTFDAPMDAAVRAVQKSHPQLNVDGVLGPATKAAVQREVDATAKVSVAAAATATPGIGTVAVDQASGGPLPGWAYVGLAVLVVAAVGWYAWKYRDELVAKFKRLGA